MKESNIISPCYEQGESFGSFLSEDGKRIPTLAEKGGIKRVVGREIIDASRYLGSYGMGGPGFFGIKLKRKSYWEEEWLVLRLWAADQWLLVDGKWLDCAPDQRDDSKCFFSEYRSDFSSANKQVKEFFTGMTIGEFTIGNNWFKMMLIGEVPAHSFGPAPVAERYILELPADLNRLPKFGNGSDRNWFEKDKVEDAFLVSPTPYINI